MESTLIITADDFGYHPRYDEGILEAVAAGAVDAVSVMSGRVRELPDVLLEADLALGVHLEAAPGGELDEARVEELIRRFEVLAGRAPDYLDGHRHCHVGVAAVSEVAVDRDLAVRSIGIADREALRAKGVRTPDRLVGRLSEEEAVMPPEIGSPAEGWTEWMTHPGRRAGGHSRYDAGREEDLAVLLGLSLPGRLTRSDQRSLPG